LSTRDLTTLQRQVTTITFTFLTENYKLGIHFS